MRWEVKNAQVVSPDGILPGGGLVIDDNRIAAVTKKAQTGQERVQLDLDGMLLFPGIINGHDHLLGTYLPKVGDNRPYLNWLPWDNDLKGSPIYAERQRLDAKQLYYLGAYRHLICGVTSVHDHIPHFVQEPYVDLLPIRVLTEFTMMHSICSFSLTWGKGIAEEYAKAAKGDMPFVTHCSEGFDEETKAAVQTLANNSGLGEHTVLVHGIAFSDSDIELLAKKKCNVVWCPDSNLYMFNETTNIKGLLEAGVNVCLGTDSPMSGSVNMFDEFATAKEFYANHYGEEISDETLFEMVTTNPAKAFRISDRVGSLEANKLADFVVLDGKFSNPYKSFTSATLADVKLVVIDGKPQYGDRTMASLFDTLNIPYFSVTIEGHNKIASQDLQGLMDSVRDSLGFHKELSFLPTD